MPPMSRKEYMETLRSEPVTPSFYRDLAAEFTSTFLLTCSAQTLGMSWDKENMGTTLQVALGMGFTVGSLAWSLVEFGGIHMNPSVTLSLVVLLEMTITKGLLFIGIQIAAATASTAFIRAILPELVTNGLGPTVVHPSLTPLQGMVFEIWLTFYLMLVVLGSTDGIRKKNLHLPPLIISMTVTTAITCGLGPTGCSMNSALTLGPAIVTGIWDNHWVYWAGPLLGSGLAILVYKVLFDMADRKDARPSTRLQYYDPLAKKTAKKKVVECTKSSFLFDTVTHHGRHLWLKHNFFKNFKNERSGSFKSIDKPSVKNERSGSFRYTDEPLEK